MYQNLWIHLQNGFQNDGVQIFVNGKKIYDHITTTQINIGRAVVLPKISVPSSIISFKIVIPSKNILDTSDINLDHGNHIGITISDDKQTKKCVEILQQKKAFWYD